MGQFEEATSMKVPSKKETGKDQVNQDLCESESLEFLTTWSVN